MAQLPPLSHWARRSQVAGSSGSPYWRGGGAAVVVVEGGGGGAGAAIVWAGASVVGGAFGAGGAVVVGATVVVGASVVGGTVSQSVVELASAAGSADATCWSLVSAVAGRLSRTSTGSTATVADRAMAT